MITMNNIGHNGKESKVEKCETSDKTSLKEFEFTKERKLACK